MLLNSETQRHYEYLFQELRRQERLYSAMLVGDLRIRGVKPLLPMQIECHLLSDIHHLGKPH